MSEARDPSAEEPTRGNSRFPDPFAPASAAEDGGDTRRTARPTGTAASPATGSPEPATHEDGGTPGGPTTAPGDQDLPWKATAERRDLWGPVEKPLQGKVRSPASTDLTADPGSKAVGRPRFGLATRLGAPVVLGALAALATLIVVLGTGVAGPLIALLAAAGVGVLALGGIGLAVNAPRRAPTDRPVLDASVPEGTRAVLERVLEADAATRARLAEERPRATVPAATEVLDDLEELLTRMDALVGAEQLQSLRPSAGEVTMLEGMATRYVPELMDAASDTLGFLQTFAGSAREEALANLESIDRQLNVLAEGVEQIESDIVGGVSRSLEVHSEFLRSRFADQHLNPIIDV